MPTAPIDTATILPADTSTPVEDPLIEAAMHARRHAYAPYTHFDAGAAVLAESGEITTGALVENISLGLAMCAERVALFASIASGQRPVALALAAPSTAGGRTEPCGACLQVALELGGPDLVVKAVDGEGDIATSTVRELLPRGPFSGLKLA